MQLPSQDNIAAVVLAAGKGTRMKSSLPKVLHELLGEPLLGHVIKLLNQAGIARIVVVTGHGSRAVNSYLAPRDVLTVLQPEQLGTGHAVSCAEKELADFSGHILIICGDTPLFLPRTLREFIRLHIDSNNTLSVLSSVFENPHGYGRVVRGRSDDQFSGIVEEKDADDHIRKISEINTGTYLVRTEFLFGALTRLDDNNVQHEFYLTDIVSMAVRDGFRVGAFCLASENEALGINSREQLSQAESIMLCRIRSGLMAQGVTIQNALTVYVEPAVKVEHDVVLEPCVILKGNTRIGEGAHIGAFSYLKDADIAPQQDLPPFSVADPVLDSV